VSAPKFTLHGGLISEGSTIVASFESDREGGSKAAKAYLAYLRKEHADGRVAQARCREGHACDRDRIVDIRYFAKHPTRPVVLCVQHAEAMKSAAVAS
jgi:hypothetical protein